MSDSSELRRKIAGASDLQSVVRTMKTLAASNIAQYEKSVVGLADYVRAVELGLGACLRQTNWRFPKTRQGADGRVVAVVFGSDQGLVGRFNETLAEHAIPILQALPGPVRVWTVGDRVLAPIQDAGLTIAGNYPVPGSIKSISALIGEILLQTVAAGDQRAGFALHVFHNRPMAGASYLPVQQRLLPLDESWRSERVALSWPTPRQPQIIGTPTSMLQALIGEYLFASLFRASAESLASEQASRLAAMQRAERSIEDRLGVLGAAFHRMRQTLIDDELFDVVAGFEALQVRGSPPARAAGRISDEQSAPVLGLPT